MNLQPHQQRVVTEKDELDEKLTKLNTFISGEFFTSLPTDEQVRLKLQCFLMKQYSNVLNERIKAFSN